MFATKKLHEQQPDNVHYQGRMARIYCGLSDEQAIYLGAMHQKSSSFCHEISYREEVKYIILFLTLSIQENDITKSQGTGKICLL